MNITECPSQDKGVWLNHNHDLAIETDSEFVTVLPIPTDETIASHKQQPGVFGYDTSKDGEISTLAWKWIGGDIAKIPRKLVERLMMLAEMGLTPWTVEMLGFDHVSDCWYCRRANEKELQDADPQAKTQRTA